LRTIKGAADAGKVAKSLVLGWEGLLKLTALCNARSKKVHSSVTLHFTTHSANYFKIPLAVTTDETECHERNMRMIEE
jgi:hypothetical protein